MKNRFKTRKKNDYNSLDDKSNARGVNERKKTEQNRDRNKANFLRSSSVQNVIEKNCLCPVRFD